MSVDLIDHLFEQAVNELGPVYLEVPANLWNTPIGPHAFDEKEEIPEPGDQVMQLQNAFLERLSKATKPAVLIGSEVVRRSLQNMATYWLESFAFPFATTLLSKSAIQETHPLFIGTYDSDLAPKLVREAIEGSDCLITIGCVYGIDHKYLIKKHYEYMVDVSYGKARIGKNSFGDISLAHFFKSFSLKSTVSVAADAVLPTASFEARRSQIGAIASDLCTHDSLFAAINNFLKGTEDEYVFVSDTCLGSYPAADLAMPSTNMFLANPIWLSIGQGTPAGAGAFFATGKRPFIVSGDGGFQMVAQTYATMVRYRIPSIMIIIDNGLYAIEQFLLNDQFFVKPELAPIPFNELSRWNYDAFPSVFRGGKGAKVKTIEALEKVLEEAQKLKDEPFIIAVEIDQKNLPAENLQYIRDQNKTS